MASLFLLACVVVSGGIVRGSIAQYIYYEPTPPAVADAMLKLAQVTADDIVCDLGSGDGRIVIMAGQKYGARGVGIEMQSSLVHLARKAALDAKVADRVTFTEGDMFAADISEATVVTLYLSPSVNKLLEQKLKRELRPGTRIVSHRFGIGDWRPDQAVRTADGRDLFLWTVPRRPVRTPDVDFAPTRPAVADAMLTLARVKADDVVYDLGSGDGRIVMLAAQKYGARGVGIELDPPLVDLSRQVAREGGVADKATFVEGDFFTANIVEATVVVLSLSSDVNRRLAPKLRRELRPGARIVSHRFGIDDWAPDETIRAEDDTNLFLWTIPAR